MIEDETTLTDEQGDEVEELINPILIPGESILYELCAGERTQFVITNERFLVIKKKLKTKVTSISWNRVLSWSYSSRSNFRIHSELKFHVAGFEFPFVFKSPRVDMRPMIRKISERIITNGRQDV